jgi:hypothetical protein
MSTVVNEVLTANQRYASNFGNKGSLPMPPGRHFAILTCMDARLDPAQYAGLAEGDTMSSAMPAAAPAMTPSARWSFPTSCWVPASGSSSTTPIAAGDLHR